MLGKSPLSPLTQSLGTAKSLQIPLLSPACKSLYVSLNPKFCGVGCTLRYEMITMHDSLGQAENSSIDLLDIVKLVIMLPSEILQNRGCCVD